MEDNKIFMPPPPKELKNMPPLPPKNEASTNSVENEKKTEEVVAEVQKEEVVSKVETEEKKVGTSGGLKTFLYWAGFVLSIGAMGVLIYLLVK